MRKFNVAVNLALALTLLAFTALLGPVANASPRVDADPSVCEVHYEWAPGIREWKRDAGGYRVVKFRVALRIKYCGTTPTATQWYNATTCTYGDAPQACSYRYFGELRRDGQEVNHSCGHSGATIGDCYVETTGADGFASWYGGEVAIGDVCYNWEAYGEIWDVGIAGVRPGWSAQGVRTIPDFNKCE